jgi:hypothetical protein
MVGFATTTRTGRKNLTLWWSKWFGQENVGGRKEARVGVASISVLVEVFSRVDSIEEPEEFSDEFKPRWPGPHSLR